MRSVVTDDLIARCVSMCHVALLSKMAERTKVLFGFGIQAQFIGWWIRPSEAIITAVPEL